MTIEELADKNKSKLTKIANINPLGFIGRGAKSAYKGAKNFTTDAYNIAKGSNTPLEDLIIAQRKARSGFANDVKGGHIFEKIDKGKGKSEWVTTPKIEKELDLLDSVWREPGKNFRNTRAGSTPIIGDIAAQVLSGGKNAIDAKLQAAGSKVLTEGYDIAKNLRNPGTRYINKVVEQTPKGGGVKRVGELLSGSRGKRLSKSLDGKTYKNTELSRQAQDLVDSEKAKVLASRLGLAGAGGAGLLYTNN